MNYLITYVFTPQTPVSVDALKARGYCTLDLRLAFNAYENLLLRRRALSLDPAEERGYDDKLENAKKVYAAVAGEL